MGSDTDGSLPSRRGRLASPHLGHGAPTSEQLPPLRGRICEDVKGKPIAMNWSEEELVSVPERVATHESEQNDARDRERRSRVRKGVECVGGEEVRIKGSGCPTPNEIGLGARVVFYKV